MTLRSQSELHEAGPLEHSAAGTVLVIDDDALLLELMYAVLSLAGFNVLTTTRGAKGLEMLTQASGAVQVVLLDYQMPVMTGAQLLPHVRHLAPAAKVLGVSGTDPDELPVEFREGVDHLLGKPFAKDDLIAAVTALMPANNSELGLHPMQKSASRPIAPDPMVKHVQRHAANG